jgi:ribosomal protein L28
MAGGVCYHTAPLGRIPPAPLHPTPFPEDPMARSCAICGKASMGGFNPQSSGMNRVRAHRRMQPNLQPLVIDQKGAPVKALVCTRCRRTQLKASK